MQGQEGMTGSEASQQLAELRRALGERENQLDALKMQHDKAVSENRTAQSETERLLQLMQMGQEEQFAKDKTIMELQE